LFGCVARGIEFEVESWQRCGRIGRRFLVIGHSSNRDAENKTIEDVVFNNPTGELVITLGRGSDRLEIYTLVPRSPPR